MNGTVLKKTNSTLMKEVNWIINKFVSGEYKECPEIVKIFGKSSMYSFITTKDSVYINGILVVKFGEIDDWHFNMPDKWIEELFKLTTDGEITQFRINGNDIIGCTLKEE